MSRKSDMAYSHKWARADLNRGPLPLLDNSNEKFNACASNSYKSSALTWLSYGLVVSVETVATLSTLHEKEGWLSRKRSFLTWATGSLFLLRPQRPLSPLHEKEGVLGETLVSLVSYGLVVSVETAATLSTLHEKGDGVRKNSRFFSWATGSWIKNKESIFKVCES